MIPSGRNIYVNELFHKGLLDCYLIIPYVVNSDCTYNKQQNLKG